MTNETTDSKTRARLIFAARLAVILLLCALLARCYDQRSAIANALRDPRAAERPAGEHHAAAARQQAGHKRHPAAQEAMALPDKTHVLSPEALDAAPGVFARHGAMPDMEDPIAPAVGDDGASGERASGDAPPGFAPGGDGGFSSRFPGGGFGGNGGGGGSGGGGGGGGGDGKCQQNEQCSEPATLPAPPMLSAVPEPATWLLILAGFFSLGALLRFVRLSIIAAPHRPRPD